MSFVVIKSRVENKVAIHDGGVNSLSNKIRAHANFIEYTPIFLLLLFAAEYQNASGLLIHISAFSFIIARVSHFYSMAFKEKYENGRLQNSIKFRQIGILLTFANIISLAAFNIIMFF